MATYTDAKDWLAKGVSDGAIDIDALLHFVLNEVSSDDIERWFGVNMEDDCDNPGAGMVWCSECRSEVDERDYNADLDMCSVCAWKLESEEDDDDDDPGLTDPLAWIQVHMTNGHSVWLRDSDFDYCMEPDDTNVYPFGA